MFKFSAKIEMALTQMSTIRTMNSNSFYKLYSIDAKMINIARCIANSICQVACKLESHCTLQILNE